MRPSVGLLGLTLLLAPAVLAQDDNTSRERLPDLSTASVPQGDATKTDEPARQTPARPTPSDRPEDEDEDEDSTETAAPTSLEQFTDLPTIAAYMVPNQIVPNTANAPYMQKSSLPDGTVFICVGAALGFFGAAILAWRGLVAWSLHRSVKRAALAQSAADMKAMSTNPAKKRGMYNVVGANSNMSLDRLSAAPTGTSRPPKPFASGPGGTPPRNSSSLFFSPTAAGNAQRDSMANRSSSYLPAGYYPTGNAQPASGASVTHVGGAGAHLSTHSLAQPGNRFSHRSGVSPPGSPSLPPSRGYDRAPTSRDGVTSMYNRNSVATLGNSGSRGVYGGDASNNNMSQLSLNVPGGTNVPGGRAPSAYLEDLFENHGNGPKERF
ncbi:hypothetical protein M011DRAFT_397658 [Sporormia fimetaria CBS 119925]|uniref:CSI2 protein n=1 Tax=Sporormia fimetaria CBS 119925 TaxID=1340428 RepID=A0A6A6VL66_9PLEO|nr:hypothetical protein M011DRAFT_397658 [Sporormia fimetaria CBS 119925]